MGTVLLQLDEDGRTVAVYKDKFAAAHALGIHSDYIFYPHLAGCVIEERPVLI